jgi:hypothetical protein
MQVDRSSLSRTADRWVANPSALHPAPPGKAPSARKKGRGIGRGGRLFSWNIADIPSGGGRNRLADQKTRLRYIARCPSRTPERRGGSGRCAFNRWARRVAVKPAAAPEPRPGSAVLRPYTQFRKALSTTKRGARRGQGGLPSSVSPNPAICRAAWFCAGLCSEMAIK